jgi:hypothetical protein
MEKDWLLISGVTADYYKTLSNNNNNLFQVESYKSK